MTKQYTEPSENEFLGFYDDSQNSAKLSSLKKNRELIKRSRMETFDYGDMVEVIGASDGVEFLEYFVGSTGMVIGRAGNRKNPDGSQNYVVEFGELKLVYSSKDLREVIEE